MKWLFLVHQVHSPNSRERVKVWRSIKKTGAVLHRNSVYVLPFSKDRLEDLQWVCQQIQDSRGEASIFVSEAQSGVEDRLIRSIFQKERKQDYDQILAAAGGLLRRIRRACEKRQPFHERTRTKFEKEMKQLQESLEETSRIDFFSSPTGELSERLRQISTSLSNSPAKATVRRKRYLRRDYQKRVWTTREGIHIDRLSSAWLIRRFIDPAASFVFAPESRLPADAIAFDVFGAEFSHRDDHCTFETLVDCFQIRNTAVKNLAEIIHDIDLKDHKFGRREAPGIDLIVRALAESSRTDAQLLETGSRILDAIYSFLSSNPKAQKKQRRRNARS